MADNLVALQIPPGIAKSGTVYQSKGRWYDANLIRFFENTIQPVGGWRLAPSAAGGALGVIGGKARAAVSWRSDSADRYTAFGSTTQLRLALNGVLYDITPAGYVAGRADSGLVAGGGQYGNANYGAGLYGIGSTASSFVDADTWQLDPFGQWLVAVSTSDKKLYVWKNTTGAAAAQAANSPTQVRAAVVTPERFIVALGCTDASLGTFNARLVCWASQGTENVWTPSSLNSAGQLQLATNGQLVCGRRVRGQTLLWTDVDAWAMTYIGNTFIYRIDQVGDHCGIIAPNAVTVVDGRAFWMGTESFFSFNGFVQPLSSEVGDYVFSDMNRTQRAKITCVPFAEFGEIWWFYPSSGAVENDRYVIYNFRENHWTTGQLPRTCGAPAGATDYPILVDPTGAIYEHEVLNGRATNIVVGTFLADGSHFANGNFDAIGGDATTEMTPYLESGPLELGDGTQVMAVDRFVPDILAFGDVQLKLFGTFQPAQVETTYGPYPLTSLTPVRFSARAVRLRYEQVNEVGWRIGILRLGMQPAGRR